MFAMKKFIVKGTTTLSDKCMVQRVTGRNLAPQKNKIKFRLYTHDRHGIQAYSLNCIMIFGEIL